MMSGNTPEAGNVSTKHDPELKVVRLRRAEMRGRILDREGAARASRYRYRVSCRRCLRIVDTWERKEHLALAAFLREAGAACSGVTITVTVAVPGAALR